MAKCQSCGAEVVYLRSSFNTTVGPLEPSGPEVRPSVGKVLVAQAGVEWVAVPAIRQLSTHVCVQQEPSLPQVELKPPPTPAQVRWRREQEERAELHRQMRTWTTQQWIDYELENDWSVGHKRETLRVVCPTCNSQRGVPCVYKRPREEYLSPFCRTAHVTRNQARMEMWEREAPQRRRFDARPKWHPITDLTDLKVSCQFNSYQMSELQDFIEAMPVEWWGGIE